MYIGFVYHEKLQNSENQHTKNQESSETSVLDQAIAQDTIH